MLEWNGLTTATTAAVVRTDDRLTGLLAVLYAADDGPPVRYAELGGLYAADSGLEGAVNDGLYVMAAAADNDDAVRDGVPPSSLAGDPVSSSTELPNLQVSKQVY